LIGVLAIFPKRAVAFEDFWDTFIVLGTHKTLIVLASIVVGFIIFFVIPRYEFNFSIKKK